MLGNIQKYEVPLTIAQFMKFFDATQSWIFDGESSFLLHFSDDGHCDRFALFDMATRKIPTVPCGVILLVLHQYIALAIANHTHIGEFDFFCSCHTVSPCNFSAIRMRDFASVYDLSLFKMKWVLNVLCAKYFNRHAIHGSGMNTVMPNETTKNFAE